MTLKKEINLAKKTISKFLRINKLAITPKIKVSYEIEASGMYYFDWDLCSIFVNPKLARKTAKKTKYAHHGFVNSYKIEDVIYHELGHLLDDNFFHHREFMKEVDIVYVNDNSKTYYELFAEAFNLYVTNPYFLKLLAPDIFSYIKKHYKSPNSCSKKEFIRIYRTWPKHIKEHCKNDIGIWVYYGKIEVNKNTVKKYLTF